MFAVGIELTERGLLPDVVVRWGIRRLLRQGLASFGDAYPRRAWLERMRSAPIALVPRLANEQHYELPAEFFALVLGRHRKYSGCLWQAGTRDLDQAERDMLAMTCERAELRDGQRVLELGCGWGSLTLYMAERYPRSQITAVSNSASQRDHILAEAARRGLENVRVVTADMNDFRPEGRFERVVSVEMFEHMRNWEALLARVASWLEPGGSVFLHVFAHRRLCYPFEVRDTRDWMSQHFFSGGMMPSIDLLDRLETPFRTAERWVVPGWHYAKTAEAWLANLDQRRGEALRVLGQVYGVTQARRWYQRWRVFFLACAELFGFAGGDEWVVLHTRLALAETPALVKA